MKRRQSKAQQQYIQGFFKKKPCQRPVDEVQCRSEPIHPAEARGKQTSTGQSRPVRTTPAAIYPLQTDHENMSTLYKNSLDTRTHCLFGQWKKLRISIVSVQWFLIYKKRDELSRHMCSALFLSSHLCWGTWLFSCPPPPRLDLAPPPPMPPH